MHGQKMENPIKMDDLGVPLLSETSICHLPPCTGTKNNHWEFDQFFGVSTLRKHPPTHEAPQNGLVSRMLWAAPFGGSYCRLVFRDFLGDPLVGKNILYPPWKILKVRFASDFFRERLLSVWDAICSVAMLVSGRVRYKMFKVLISGFFVLVHQWFECRLIFTLKTLKYEPLD